MTKEEKKYLQELADNEYKKYLQCLENARGRMEKNDRAGVEYWLNISQMALKQAATYRTRRK